ncbi:MAG: membrane complex biogenesis BtpA family protein [Polyangiales bacterium]|jgi:membrane complex biogenesis BtpA family protein
MTLATGVIGVLHLPPLPGDPRRGTFAEARAAARRDATAYRDGGVTSLVVENFGSAPFAKGDSASRLPPHQVALMSVVVAELVADGFLIGVNCLRNDAISALGIAAATGAAFVRINVHTGAYVTDQGLIQGEAATSLRYRAALNAAHVSITADILVKHASPLAPLSYPQATEEAFDRGLADAVIVSGEGTGKAVDLDGLAQVRSAAGSRPVWVGSGVNATNAKSIAALADAAIVGTSVKEAGLASPVSAKRVEEIVALFVKTD